MSEQADRPLRVVKGEPTEDELAALVAAISAKAAEAAHQPAERPSNWAAYWRSVRAPLQPGPGAWRASANPR
ncbi:MAG TPA: acyl-CoA carboxylase subunit epsilon [Jiangellaceae bacterium]